MTMRRILIGAGTMALLGLVVLLGLFADSQAASAQSGSTTSGAKVTRVAGTIAAIQSGGFTLTTKQGSVEVSTGANTWFVGGKRGQRTEGTLADFAVGDKVAVAGTSSAAGKVDA